MADVRSLLNLTRGTEVGHRVAMGDSFWARFRGLMLRPSIAADEGLWLPGTPSIHMFFMRFPIDCAFLGPEAGDGAREVIAVREALPPWRGLVPWVRGADGVVELAAGVLQESGTRVGDRLRFEPLPTA
jgi:uncharacterized membrane protein (UPF0127 family)